MNQNYIDTVRLLLAIAPVVFSSGRFAIKGGTALNLFVQDMPRLSVDIDLVFVDHRPSRAAALQTIAEELAAMKAVLASNGHHAHLPANADGDDVKLMISSGSAQIKVEVNFVFGARCCQSKRSRSWLRHKTCSRPSWPFLYWPRPSCTAASWSRQWIDSIHETSST